MMDAKLSTSAALALAVLAVPATCGRGTAQVSSPFPQVVWAERLVDEVPADRNVYGWSPTFVVWNEDGNGPARNRSVCSSLVSHVLERAYGFGEDQLVARFGLKNPQAKDYYAAIVAERGFARVRKLRDLQPGDILAFRYPAGSHPTGHVMIVDGMPHRHSATSPVIAGTTQYELAVIDSSHSYHGFRDTRYEAAGKKGHGVGRGTLRLYAGARGEIAGYAWSTRAISKYLPQSEHEIAAGRFDPNPLPVAAPPAGAQDGGDDADDPTD